MELPLHGDGSKATSATVAFLGWEGHLFGLVSLEGLSWVFTRVSGFDPPPYGKGFKEYVLG